MEVESKEARTVRLGIIGSGLALQWLHGPRLSKMPESFAVVAVADTDPQAAEAGAQLTGAQRWTTRHSELLAADDVEAVLIALPIHLTAQVLLEASQAGKHVLCEKPIGSNLQQAQEVVTALRGAPVVVQIAEQYHHRKDIAQARSWMDEGRIGRPFLVAVASCYWTDTNEGFGSTPWRQDSQYRGGAITDGGVHQTALIRELGGDIEQLQAFTKLVHPELSGIDTMVLNLRFRSGALGQLLFSAAVVEAGASYSRATVFGTEGTIMLEDGTLRLRIPGSPEEVYEFDPDAAFYDQLVSFYRSITEGAPVVSTPEEALRDVEVLMRAYDSAESRRVELL